jgi:hypothetical protein
MVKEIENLEVQTEHTPEISINFIRRNEKYLRGTKNIKIHRSMDCS